MTKIDPKRMQLVRGLIENNGRLTALSLQVGFGFTPKVADQYLIEIKKDKEFVRRVRREAKERPILLKKYTAEIAKYLESSQAPEYFTVVDIMTKFPVKYSMASTILWDLRNRKILEDESYYKVNKKK